MGGLLGTHPGRVCIGSRQDQVWYVISSLGLFDVAGLGRVDPSFALGSPQFDRMTIRLHPDYYQGKEFVIETTNNSRTAVYAQRYRLNGQPLTELRIPFSVLTAGGRLEVEMGETPQDHYGE